MSSFFKYLLEQFYFFSSENQNKICIDVGLNFFLECSNEEAIKIISQRKPLLQNKIRGNERKLSEILANIQIVKKFLSKYFFKKPFKLKV